MSDPDLNIEVCCTCLTICSENDIFLSLDTAPAEDISYKKKLKSCVPEMGLEYNQDCFLCTSCTVALESAYSFRCMCLRTDGKLEDFKSTQKRSAARRSIKQEMLDLASSIEESSSVDEEPYATGPLIQAEATYHSAVQSDEQRKCTSPPQEEKYSDFTEEPTQLSVPTHEAYLSSHPSCLEEIYSGFAEDPTQLAMPAEEVCSSSLSALLEETAAVARDTKIDIVKDELGTLLTESLGSAIDINIHIFNQNPKHPLGINSEINILESLDAEIEELNKHSFHNKRDLTQEGRIMAARQSKAYGLSNQQMKDTEGVVTIPKLPEKRLSDAEIVEICCKTNPELRSCPPKSLDCQVTLEKIVVNELPVIITTVKAKKVAKVRLGKDPKGKVFWCYICNKDIRRKDRFNAHILRHSNIKGYKCQKCPERFFSSDALSKHRRSCLAVKPMVNATEAFNAAIKAGTLEILPAPSLITPAENNLLHKLPKKRPIKKITGTRIKPTKRVQKKEAEKILRVIKTENNSSPPSSTQRFTPPRNTRNSTPPRNTRKSTRKLTPSKRLISNLNDIVYRCKQCTYQSYHKQKYQVHLLHHSNNRPFPCTECSKRFYERWELNRHIRVTHTSSPTKVTPPTKARKGAAGKSVIRKTQTIAKAVPASVVVQPPSNITTTNRAGPWDDDPVLRMIEPAISLTVQSGTVVTPVIHSYHSLASSPIQGDPVEMSFACKMCNISFKSRNLLMLHTQAHVLKHTCKVCGQEFMSESEFAQHEQTHLIVIKEIKSIQVELAPKLPKKKIKKRYFCMVCNAEFASRDHGNVHTGAKPYECQVCFKKFAAYTTLRKHKWTHGGLQPGGDVATAKKVATVQKVGAAQKAAPVKKTAKQINPQRKLHACEICGKKFVNKEHVFSHSCHTTTGASVYRCQICKNAFVGRAALIEHMGLHVSQSATE